MNNTTTISWHRIMFSLTVLAYAGFLGFITVMMVLPGNWISAMGHFGFFTTRETDNLIHELVFALIIGTGAVGLLSQLWKPMEQFAGQLVALIAWLLLMLTAAITGNWVPQPLFVIFGGLTLLATLLHPAGFGLFRWLGRARVNRVLLGLVLIAAVPLTLLAFTSIHTQIAGGGNVGFFDHKPPALHGGTAAPVAVDHAGATDDGASDDQEHGAAGHNRNMAALSFIIILAGLLASFQPRGWRFAACVAGGLPILLGFASVVLPDAESSFGVAWGVAAIVWGIAFVMASEFIAHQMRSASSSLKQSPLAVK